MVDVITIAPTLRAATSAPVLQTLSWALMAGAVHVQRVMLQGTTLHVKVGPNFTVSEDQ